MIRNKKDTNFILTRKYQHGKHFGNKRKNVELYFLNGIPIHEARVPYDSDFEYGFETKWATKDTYILDNYLYETRFDGKLRPDLREYREVKFPLSKKKLEQFDIPNGMKIELVAYKYNGQFHSVG